MDKASQIQSGTTRPRPKAHGRQDAVTLVVRVRVSVSGQASADMCLYLRTPRVVPLEKQRMQVWMEHFIRYHGFPPVTERIVAEQDFLTPLFSIAGRSALLSSCNDLLQLPLRFGHHSASASRIWSLVKVRP